MIKVNGIGGVFIYANDPTSLAEWYARHFGLELKPIEGEQTHYMVFTYRDHNDSSKLLSTVFAIMPAVKPLSAERGECMINYRVDDLEEFVRQLGAEGIATEPIAAQFDGEGLGKFTHLRDPEGNRIELWQPSSTNQS
jgi:predicted enzyme related to lactoylglutathione lyase